MQRKQNLETPSSKPIKDSLRIVRRKPRTGTLSAWIDDGEVYIRESIDRGRDVQTVVVTKDELRSILNLEEEAAR